MFNYNLYTFLYASINCFCDRISFSPDFFFVFRNLSRAYIELIRGKGLWIGIVLKASAGGARRFCEALQARGLLCKETHETVIRVAPPLTISREEIGWAVDQIREVLTSM